MVMWLVIKEEFQIHPPPAKMIYSITNDEQLPGLLENNKLIPTSGFIPK